MKNRIFLINIIAVTGTALLLRSISIYLSAYLSRKIGAEGVGLYNLILSIYIMASALVTSGISLAVSRIIAEQMEKKSNEMIRPTMIKCLILSAILSLVTSIFLYIGSDFIAESLLGDKRAASSLIIMAPSFPFMAISSCMRGYFIAARKAYKSSSSSLFEQLFRIALTVIILQRSELNDPGSACAMVVLGSTSAETIGCLFTFILYIFERRKCGQTSAHSLHGASLHKILGISLPITLNSGVRTGLRTAESMLIPAGLQKSGISHEASLAEFGTISGMAMPVLFFPASFLMSAAMLILPEIARAAACKRYRRVQYMGGRIIQLTLYMSLIIAAVFIIFSSELCMALYKNNEAGRMLKLLSPLIPLIYLDFMVDGMLNGLNQQMTTLKLNTVDSALRIGMILFLVPLLGVNGYIITLYISTLFNSSLSLRRLFKVSGLHIPIYQWIIKPVMLALLSALISSIIFNIASSGLARAGALAVPEIICACLVYLGLLRISGGLTRDDITWFKNLFTNKMNTDKKPAIGLGGIENYSL